MNSEKVSDIAFCHGKKLFYYKFPVYDILKDHPRYVELLEKLKNSDRCD